MLQRVALYDFDNTIASGDSIVRLLKYDLKKQPIHCFYFFKVAFYYGLYLLHVVSFEKAKSALLFPLDYMTDAQLKTFYQQEVIPSYYSHIVKQMEQEKHQGYVVIICTASCEAYMQYQQLPCDVLLGTKTKHGTSQIVGLNCKGQEKVPRILNYLKSKNMEIDFEHSIAYSDSTSDLPMLSLVKNRKRIALKTGQVSDFK